jgi:hypothetical protein
VVIGDVLSPKAVTLAHQQMRYGLSRQRQRADYIPTGNGEHSWLKCVEHRKKEMNPFNQVLVVLTDLFKIPDPNGGGYDARSGAGNIVGAEHIPARIWLATTE